MRKVCIVLLVATLGAAADPIPFFVANEGQWDAPFAFQCKAGSAVFYVTSSGLTMDFREVAFPPTSVGGNKGGPFFAEAGRLTRPQSESGFPPLQRGDERGALVRGHVLKMNFVEANPTPELIGQDKLPSYSNYFLGRDSCRWRSYVGHYQKVVAKEVWPGIDVEFVAQAEGIETLYRVKPGADPSRIVIEYEGLEAPLSVHANGRLHLRTSLGDVYEKAPFAYQIMGRRQVEVPARFELLNDSRYGLRCEGYDAQTELVIDPLVYGTFLGGYGPDYVWDITMDITGNLVAGGTTEANDFPVTPGAYQDHRFSHDGFVTKFIQFGDSVVFSTYLGAWGGGTSLNGLGLSPAGALYAVGSTTSPTWPLTPDAFDTLAADEYEGFLVRLSADGTTLEYSSYAGGGGNDFLRAVAVDSSGLVYFCGETQLDFPITEDALFPQHPGSDGVLGVFDPSDSRLRYATYIPGNWIDNANHLRLVRTGVLWVWGYTTSTDFPVTEDAFQAVSGSTDHAEDGFFMLWDLNANRLVYSSYLGGSRSDGVSALDWFEGSRLVLSGSTTSSDFPLTPDAYDTTLSFEGRKAFVTAIQLPNVLVHSTLLGGTGGYDRARGVTADERGIVVAGQSNSYDFPTTPGAFDTVFNGSGQPAAEEDLFVTRFDTALSRLDYSTFIGGWSLDRCYTAYFQSSDTVWLGGETGSDDFPITPNAFQSQYAGLGDGFVLGFALPRNDTTFLSPVAMLPLGLSLTAYPNPFNSTATIAFTLTHRTTAVLRVYDLLGREVYAIPLGWLNAGEHRRAFDASRLPSGRYLALLEAGNNWRVAPLMILR